MNLLKGLGLVGIGYFLSNKYTLTKVHTYKPYNPNRISYSDYFHELVINKLDILFYGGEVHSKRRNKIIYSSYKPRALELDEITFDTRTEAEEVLMFLDEAIEKYGKVTIADFKDRCGVTSNFTDNNYGWTSLEEAKVMRLRSGYFINFPSYRSFE